MQHLCHAAALPHGPSDGAEAPLPHRSYPGDGAERLLEFNQLNFGFCALFFAEWAWGLAASANRRACLLAVRRIEQKLDAMAAR